MPVLTELTPPYSVLQWLTMIRVSSLYNNEKLLDTTQVPPSKKRNSRGTDQQLGPERSVLTAKCETPTSHAGRGRLSNEPSVTVTPTCGVHSAYRIQHIEYCVEKLTGLRMRTESRFGGVLLGIV